MIGEGGGGEDSKRGPSAPPRPSMPPRPSTPPRPSVPSSAGGSRANWRIVLAAVWIAVQATLAVTADRRIDGPFDFRLYRESLTVKVALTREIDAGDGHLVRVPAPGGGWSARGRDGSYRRQSWYDRVLAPHWSFDREVEACHGDVEIGRLQSALDDVALHLSPDDDVETHRLILDVTIRRNGRDPVSQELASRDRLGAEAARGGI